MNMLPWWGWAILLAGPLLIVLWGRHYARSLLSITPGELAGYRQLPHAAARRLFFSLILLFTLFAGGYAMTRDPLAAATFAAVAAALLAVTVLAMPYPFRKNCNSCGRRMTICRNGSGPEASGRYLYVCHHCRQWEYGSGFRGLRSCGAKRGGGQG